MSLGEALPGPSVYKRKVRSLCVAVVDSGVKYSNITNNRSYVCDYHIRNTTQTHCINKNLTLEMQCNEHWCHQSAIFVCKLCPECPGFVCLLQQGAATAHDKKVPRLIWGIIINNCLGKNAEFSDIGILNDDLGCGCSTFYCHNDQGTVKGWIHFHCH